MQKKNNFLSKSKYIKVMFVVIKNLHVNRRPCFKGNFDFTISKNIINEMVKTCGCIAPYISYTPPAGVGFCNDTEKAKSAFDILKRFTSELQLYHEEHEHDLQNISLSVLPPCLNWHPTVKGTVQMLRNTQYVS